ncbi:VOC family protein [Virgibacillus dakarensis]|uniref:Glyoxalase/fosfomycin resistance/dioxygenase domain-containing protein n=1 Tax=Lentibacillus populi TaxID=1827502 RepID=A0A9W5X6Z4_9BACI|nr:MULTISPECIES: VOC family protein [Bacillaceae]MBT2216880.1 VOC family protein [Virgibacillus dakarensis]MTW86901.1 VOC family protein [Virgibacillus dakarensis]GGB52336.1 hypothetical protein GCM10011409_32370 [Lentibacillus populi]
MNPILKQIGAIFMPVKNIEEARKWYCDILGIPADGRIVFGHLYIITMSGTEIVLDSKIFSKDNVFRTPPFHFNTTDIEKAYKYMKGKNVEIVTEIQFDQWFNFKDPDGNHLMICQC